MEFKSVSIIGLGYIGLPTAAMFASQEVNVIGVDVNTDIIATINRGEIHIVEPDLDSVVRKSVQEGFLTATSKARPADAFIIAVPTPFKEGNKPDLSYIRASAQSIAPVLKKGDLVILESTSPVGTTEKLATWISELRPDLAVPTKATGQADINIAHCPERVLPGRVMRELIENDRIIGGITKECAVRSIELYRIFVEGECLVTDARTAEMAKLTENSFRDVNIAYANELSMICEELEINVWELISLSNRHPRVNILQPGCGVGGHCIAVDPWFIVDSTPSNSKLIHTARLVNDGKPDWVVEQIKAKTLLNKTRKIVCMGLSFKPDIDDLRESPALQIVEKLAQYDFELEVIEPNIIELPQKLQRANVTLSKFANIDLRENKVFAVLVAHTPFLSDVEHIGTNKILDFCGAFKSLKGL